MNSIWNPILVINGLVVPVQLFSAVQKSKVSFEMIDSRDKAKIRLIRTNEITNQPVPQQFIGKGYQRDEERILVAPDLIASCLPPVSNQIVFGYFIDSWELPYTRIDSFYYALPMPGEEMNYALVLKALNDQNMVGIAQATYQNCCNLFALGTTCTDAINRVSANDRLVLYKLRFDDQISACDAPVLPQLDSEDDAVMAALKSYMNANCGVFDVSGFRDTFNDNFLEAIAA
jgi:DNA end-binding protein Ku